MLWLKGEKRVLEELSISPICSVRRCLIITESLIFISGCRGNNVCILYGPSSVKHFMIRGNPVLAACHAIQKLAPASLFVFLSLGSLPFCLFSSPCRQLTLTKARWSMSHCSFTEFFAFISHINKMPVISVLFSLKKWVKQGRLLHHIAC